MEKALLYKIRASHLVTEQDVEELKNKIDYEYMFDWFECGKWVGVFVVSYDHDIAHKVSPEKFLYETMTKEI